MVISLERGADLHVANPADATVSGFSKIQIGFTFLVPAHPGSFGKRAFNGRLCVSDCFFSTLVSLHKLLAHVLFLMLPGQHRIPVPTCSSRRYYFRIIFLCSHIFQYVAYFKSIH